MSTRVNSGVTKNPAYNANGQQTDDGVNYTYEWDAFGRLRKVKNRSNSALVVEYTYNGLNHQIGRHADLDADGDVDSTDKWEWTIYDPRWRRVATYMVAGGSAFTGAVDSNPRERYVHHASGRSGMGSYIDSVILRDRDQTGSNNSSADATMEQRLYYGQNLGGGRADVSVTMTDTGRILERIKYSAYGVATRVPVADFNGDGFVDAFDDMAYDDCYTGVSCPSGQTADMNLDGFVDSFDYDEWDLTFSEQGSTARGVLSQSSGSAAVNRLGYAGYWFEPSTQQYLVRNRELDPLVGVWDERDPMGYHDGADLYMYVMDSPVGTSDPDGLVSQTCGGRMCNAASIMTAGGPAMESTSLGVLYMRCSRCCQAALAPQPNLSPGCTWRFENHCFDACVANGGTCTPGVIADAWERCFDVPSHVVCSKFKSIMAASCRTYYAICQPRIRSGMPKWCEDLRESIEGAFCHYVRTGCHAEYPNDQFPPSDCAAGSWDPSKCYKRTPWWWSLR